MWGPFPHANWPAEIPRFFAFVILAYRLPGT